jgi:Fur family ferric uptake transcriptional regulator
MIKSLSTRYPCGRPGPDSAKRKTKAKKPARELWKDKLKRYFAEKALKQSDARNKLIELVLSETEHFTAQDLIRRVSERHPQIGAATVYRNIPVLLDAGIIEETLTDKAGQKLYEVASSGDGDEHHDHIVCIDCNEIFEFHNDQIERAQEQLTATLKFAPVKHRHVIFAHCGYLKKGIAAVSH